MTDVLARGLKSVNIIRTKAVQQIQQIKPNVINGEVDKVWKKMSKHKYAPFMRKASYAIYGTTVALGFLWVMDSKEVINPENPVIVRPLTYEPAGPSRQHLRISRELVSNSGVLPMPMITNTHYNAFITFAYLDRINRKK